MPLLNGLDLRNGGCGLFEACFFSLHDQTEVSKCQKEWVNHQLGLGCIFAFAQYRLPVLHASYHCSLGYSFWIWAECRKGECTLQATDVCIYAHTCACPNVMYWWFTGGNVDYALYLCLSIHIEPVGLHTNQFHLQSVHTLFTSGLCLCYAMYIHVRHL